MSTNIDQRVVEMRFDNAQFEKGVKNSMNSLSAFEQELRKAEGARGLENLNASADKVTSSFVAMAAKATIVYNIVNDITNAAKNMVKALTVDQLRSGMNEYELKMGSIQTIMNGANASLEETKEALEDLNTYADRTIYIFQDMTSNIGKFTNAGVKLDVAVQAMKGISNEAALAGASAQEASRAMYNIAQALGTGHMQLIDWKSIENANMATMDFKNNLIETAKEMGVLNEASEVTSHNFRDTLKDKWLTNEVLLRTLEKYADETTELGKKAYAAAQDIKTANQLWDVMKESVQSGWAQTWEYIVGDFDQAKKLFTGIGKAFDLFAGAISANRNNMFKFWNEFGGRTQVIQGLTNILANLLLVIKPIKDAFNEMFPKMTGKRLVDLSIKFRELTNHIWITKDASEGLKNVVKLLLIPFKALGEVLKIAWSALKIFVTILSLATNSILALFKNMDGLDNILLKIFGNERYTRIMNAFGQILINVVNGIFSLINGIVELGHAIRNIPLVDNIISSAESFMASGFDKFLDTIVDILESIANFDFTFDKVDLSWFDDIYTFDDLFAKIGQSVLKTKDAIVSFAKGFNLELPTMQVGKLRDFLSAVLGKMEELSRSLTPSKVLVMTFGIAVSYATMALGRFIFKISEFADELVEGLSAVKWLIRMEAFNKAANAIMKLAIAFGVLAASIGAFIAFNKTGELESMLVLVSAFAFAMTALTIALGKGTTLDDGATFAAMVIGLAGSLVLLAAAMKVLQGVTLDDDLAFKILVLTAAMGAFAALSHVMLKALPESKGAVKAGLFIVSLAFALEKMANVFTIMNDIIDMNAVDDVIGMSALMVALGTFLSLAGNFKLTSALGIIALCLSMQLVADSIKKLLEVVDFHFITEGLVKLKNAFVTIYETFMPLDNIQKAWAVGGLLALASSFTAAAMGIGAILKGFSYLTKGLVSIAAAIGIITVSMRAFKDMDADTIAKGMDVIKQIMLTTIGMIGVLGLASGTFDKLKGSITKGGVKGFFDKIWGGTGESDSYFVQLGKSASRIGTAMIKVSVAITMLVGAMKLIEFLDPTKIDKGLTVVVTLMGAFTLMIAAAGLCRRATPAIIALAATIGILVTALALFTMIPDQTSLTTASSSLMKGILGMAALVGAVALMFRNLAKFEIKDYVGTIALLIASVGSMLGFVVVVKKLGDVDWDKGIKAATALGIFATALATSVLILSNASFENLAEVGRNISALLGVAGVLSLFAVAFGYTGQAFAKIPWNELIPAMFSLGLFAIAASKAVEILSGAEFKNLDQVKDSLLAFLGISAVMNLFAVGFGYTAKEFASIPWNELIPAMFALSLFALAAAQATKTISNINIDGILVLGNKKMINALIGFAGIAGTMVVFAGAFAKFASKFANIPFKKLISSALSLGVFANAFAYATKILSKANFKSFEDMIEACMAFGAIAFATSIAINQLTPSLIDLSDVPFRKLMSVTAAISALMVVMSGATVILAWASKFATSIRGIVGVSVILIAVSGAIWILSEALEQIKDASVGKIYGLIGALALLGVAAGGLGAALVYIPGVIEAFAAGIIALGSVDLILIGAAFAMNLFAKACQGLAKAFDMSVTSMSRFMDELEKHNLSKLAGGMVAMAIGIGALAAASLLLVPGALAVGVFALALAGLAVALAIIASIVSGSDLADKMFAFGMALINNFTGGIDEDMDTVADKAVETFDNFVSTLNDKIENSGVLENLGRKMIQKLYSSFTKAILPKASLKDMFPNIEQDTENYYIERYGSMENYEKYSNKPGAGHTFAQEYIDELNESAPAAEEATRSWWQRVTDVLNEFKFDATNNGIGIGMGLGVGIGLSAPQATKAASNMASSVEGEFKNIADEVTPLGAEVPKKYTDEMLRESINQKNRFRGDKAFITNIAIDQAKKAVKDVEKEAKKIPEAYSNNVKLNPAQKRKVQDDIEKSIKEPMYSGIKNTKRTVNDAIGELADTTVDKFGGFMTPEQKTKTKDAIVNVFGGIFGDMAMDGPIASLLESLLLGETEKGFNGFIGTLMDSFGITDLKEQIFPNGNPFENLGGGLEGLGGGGGGGSAAKEVEDAMKTIRDSIDSTINIFERFDEVEEISANKLLGNMASQIRGTEKWANSFEQLAQKGFSEEIIKKLADMGPESAKYIKGMLKMSDSYVQAYNLMFGATTKLADSSIDKIKIALPTMTKVVAEETGKTVDMVGKNADTVQDSVDDTIGVMQDLGFTVQRVGKIDVPIAVEVLSELSDVNVEVTETTTDLADAIDETSDNSDDLNDSLKDTTTVGVRLVEVTKDMVLAYMEANAKMEEWKENLKDTVSGSINIFEKFDTTTEKSAQDYVDSINSQLKAMEFYKTGLLELENKGFDQRYIEEIANKGVDGAYEIIAALKGASESQVDEVNKAYANSLYLKDNIVDELGERFRDAGFFTIEGYTKGLTENQQEIADAFNLISTFGLENFLEFWGIHSPSEVMEEKGEFIDEGLKLGIHNRREQVKAEAKIMSTGVLNQVKGILSHTNFSNIGKMICQGLIDGINSKRSEVEAAARDLANAVKDAFNFTVEVRSPSRVFKRSGKYIDEGLAIGITENAGMVTDSIENVGKSAIDSMAETLKHVSDVISTDIDAEPVIRPVLDLSEIQNGSNLLDNMLNKSTSIAARKAGELAATYEAAKDFTGASSTENNNAGNTFNFTQNNYSPKALDRIEIYRQTNNQFSKMKGLVYS